MPPDGWLAYFTYPEAPFYVVKPLTDRALVTANSLDIDSEGNFHGYREDSHDSKLVGFVAFGGNYVCAEDDSLAEQGILLLAYVHPDHAPYLDARIPRDLAPELKGRDFLEIHNNLAKSAQTTMREYIASLEVPVEA